MKSTKNDILFKYARYNEVINSVPQKNINYLYPVLNYYIL